MSKIPISVCIIAKNEEKYIEGCLQKLLPYGFEIIVADTGSTDRTREIAKQYADKVVDFAWIDDFSAARNFCVSQASNYWILSLDCDEYLESANIQQLRMIMQKFPRGLGVIRIKNLVYTETGEKRYTSDDVIRFFNKNFFHYESPIHEQLCPSDTKTDRNKVMNIILPVELVHYGYLISKEEMQEKQKRNLGLICAALRENPDDPYLYFQKGQSKLIIGEHEEACAAFEKGLSYDVSPDTLYVEMMIEGLATTYVQMGRFDEAQALLEKYQSQCRTAKYTYFMANIYMDCDQPMKGLLYYLKAVTMNDVETLGEGLLICYKNIIDIYLQMGDEKMAALFLDKYEKCLEERKRIMGE